MHLNIHEGSRCNKQTTFNFRTTKKVANVNMKIVILLGKVKIMVIKEVKNADRDSGQNKKIKR